MTLFSTKFNNLMQEDFVSSLKRDCLLDHHTSVVESESVDSLIASSKYYNLSYNQPIDYDFYPFQQVIIDKELFNSYKSAGHSIVEQWRLLQNCQHFCFISSVTAGETSFAVHSSQLISRLTFLKINSLSLYEQLIDITAIDHVTKSQRFEVVYQLLSINYSKRITFSVYTSEELSLESATNVYINAGWYEREVWDRFGVFFSNHPDLRRMLTDYGFKGHPLRKDFPGTGYVEVRYNGYTKSISYEKVNLQQASRETVALFFLLF